MPIPTMQLFSTLIADSADGGPLLRAAFTHAETAGLDNDTVTMLNRMNPPADLLTRYARSTNPRVRTAALAHPRLPQPLRENLIRKERSVTVLRDLAACSNNQDVLHPIVERALNQPNMRSLIAALLASGNADAITGPDRNALIVAVDVQLSNCTPRERKTLQEDERARAAVRAHPQATTPVVTSLRYATLLSHAITTCGEHLTGDQWQQLAALRTEDLRGGMSDKAAVFLAVLESSHAPLASKRQAADVLLTGHRKALTQANLKLALDHQPDPELDEETLLIAAQGTQDQLSATFQSNCLPTRAARAILANPHANVNYRMHAARRAGLTGDEVRQLILAAEDARTLTAFVIMLGPESLTVAQELRPEDAEKALTAILHGIHAKTGKWRTLPETQPWLSYLDQLSPTILARTPWPEIRTLATVSPGIRSWLSTQLDELFSCEGAATLFTEMDLTFTGPAADLLTAIRAAVTTA